MKKIIGIMMVVIFSMSMFALGDSDGGHGSFEEAEEIINQKISCDDLNDEQLENLGDYYMEQMHPGERHNVMDEMIGGEGSESLKVAHINMAKKFYCGDQNVMSTGMMNIMMGRDNSKIDLTHRRGMMNMMGYGNGIGWFGGSLIWLLYVALAAFVFGIIFWGTYKLMIKDKRRRRK
jgi:hypothetical protein